MTDCFVVLCLIFVEDCLFDQIRQTIFNSDQPFPRFLKPHSLLGPSINGLVTDVNTKLCCKGFVLALFQSTIAYKIDSECTRDYTKSYQVCKVEILQVTVNKVEVLSTF